MQEHLLGTPERVGRRDRHGSTDFLSSFWKVKSYIERMSSRITFAEFSSLNVKFLGELCPVWSISALTL